MKAMNACRKYGTKLAAVGGLMGLSAMSVAGPIADAVTSSTADFKTDFTAVGGIAVGIALIGIGFVAAIRMLKRGI
ncbi:hypothetical protein [Paralysiella testudinis]|uniref:Uncharacterized protein n=1 Tax=Paralysiella testudinis TaxID=2809020 RepID=A0A892ZHW9_9NEIS|nr:hypothetical protein [Paralysiella testudinis]QRQ82532.1 hypothetical protein JQU52_03795 [Paralysiella testudinis]